MNVIRVDYEAMKRVAGVFEQKAGEVEAILAALRKRIDQLDKSWDGIAEQAFRQEWSSCDLKLSATPQMLREIASALRRIEEELRNAEEQLRSQIPGIIVSDNR